MSPTLIETRRGSAAVDARELWSYRDLLYFLVRRDIRARYAQTILGFGWAIIQPVFAMIVFTVVFGRLAGVPSDGIPYPIFTYAALVPWVYFSGALTGSTDSLVGSASLIGKVYFPRLVIPLTPVLSKLVDFAIALGVLAILMAVYGFTPTPWAAVLPLLVLVMVLTATGLGAWLTSLAIRYRDVRYAMQFGIQLLMYAAPIVYPVSLVPERYRLVYALNPMVGVIDGFRAALLGGRPMPWDLIAVGACASVVALVGGVLRFQRVERTFADVL